MVNLKIFILYLQIDDGSPRLDRQHFALYTLDHDANDDGELLDVGTYTWESQMVNTAVWRSR